jgi:methyl-accepting chemotaxis protein
MAGMLDSIFESVKDRGERQSQFFLKYVGGTPTLSPESSKVGAGEQGRGFAVVADEVRKLAERTALSTQEISTTVRAILEETSVAVKRMQVVSASMAGSVGLAREAGESLSLIDEHARQTVETVQSIADSTREQSAASQEIARLVESIAQMAEGSSSRAVNNTERAKNLQRLATELQAQLSRFTT